MDTDNQVKIDSLKAEMKKVATLIRFLNVVIDRAEKGTWSAESGTWEDLHLNLHTLVIQWEDNWAKLCEDLIILRTPRDSDVGIRAMHFRLYNPTGGPLETVDEFELNFFIDYSFEMSARDRGNHRAYLLRNPESGLLEADYSKVADKDNLLKHAKTIVLWFLDWFGHYPNPDDVCRGSWFRQHPVVPAHESWKDYESWEWS